MTTALKLLMTVGLFIAILLVFAWLGFQTAPSGFELAEKTMERGNVQPPQGLPEPVLKYFNAIGRTPSIESAVVWGTGRMQPVPSLGISMPVRFIGYYLPGMEFYRYMEITWFGLPVLQGRDSYIKGRGQFEIKGLGFINMTDSGEKIDKGQILAMWGEVVWMPSAYIPNNNISWERINSTEARLIVPSGNSTDRLLFEFDPYTGLISMTSALRYRDSEKNKTPWHGDDLEWKSFNGIKIPSKIEVVWEDQGKPWLVLNVEGIAYNVDISKEIPS